MRARFAPWPGVLAGVLLAGAAVLASAGEARVAAVGIPSCGAVYYEGRGTPALLVVSDLPLRGARASEGAAMSRAIRFVLKKRGFKAGGRTVGYRACNDASPETGTWDPARCTANGYAFAHERSVVGVIGPVESDCAKLLLPNSQRGLDGPLAVVSPLATDPGLTRAVDGLTLRGEPGIHYPTGKRSFARVITTDDVQPLALAKLTRRLGKRRPYVLTDGGETGRWQADSYRRAAEQLGLEIAGAGPWKAASSAYEGLARTIRASGADAVFLGGAVESNGARLVRDLRAGLGDDVALVAPSTFTPVSAVVDGAGSRAEGLYVAVTGHSLERLGPVGRRFVRELAVFQKSTKVGVPAAYAAQAAVVLLDAVARSTGTRASVVAQLRRTRIDDGILGSFRIDARGDTSLKVVSIYRIARGKAEFDRVLDVSAG